MRRATAYWQCQSCGKDWQKSDPHTQAVVLELPRCDICQDSTEASYDAKTWLGPWAYLCELHFRTHAPGKLGLGVGQRLVTPDEVGREASSWGSDNL
jgi:NAD-dependent SIR2 family protein deacetylase